MMLWGSPSPPRPHAFRCDSCRFAARSRSLIKLHQTADFLLDCHYASISVQQWKKGEWSLWIGARNHKPPSPSSSPTLPPPHSTTYTQKSIHPPPPPPSPPPKYLYTHAGADTTLDTEIEYMEEDSREEEEECECCGWWVLVSKTKQPPEKLDGEWVVLDEAEADDFMMVDVGI